MYDQSCSESPSNNIVTIVLSFTIFSNTHALVFSIECCIRHRQPTTTTFFVLKWNPGSNLVLSPPYSPFLRSAPSYITHRHSSSFMPVLLWWMCGMMMENCGNSASSRSSSSKSHHIWNRWIQTHSFFVHLFSSHGFVRTVLYIQVQYTSLSITNNKFYTVQYILMVVKITVP